MPATDREAIANATDIYRQTATDTGDPLPIETRYLKALAENPSIPPVDILTLANELSAYPHIAAPVTRDIGTDRIALPPHLIYAAHAELVKLAKKSGQDAESVGKVVRDKAKEVLLRLGKVGAGEIDTAIFSAVEKQVVTPGSNFKPGADFWWNTVIPNVLASESLRATALKREPTILSSAPVQNTKQ